MKGENPVWYTIIICLQGRLPVKSRVNEITPLISGVRNFTHPMIRPWSMGVPIQASHDRPGAPDRARWGRWTHLDYSRAWMSRWKWSDQRWSDQGVITVIPPIHPPCISRWNNPLIRSLPVPGHPQVKFNSNGAPENHMDVSKNRGKNPKINGENNGQPY